MHVCMCACNRCMHGGQCARMQSRVSGVPRSSILCWNSAAVGNRCTEKSGSKVLKSTLSTLKRESCWDRWVQRSIKELAERGGEERLPRGTCQPAAVPQTTDACAQLLPWKIPVSYAAPCPRGGAAGPAGPPRLATPPPPRGGVSWVRRACARGSPCARELGSRLRSPLQERRLCKGGASAEAGGRGAAQRWAARHTRGCLLAEPHPLYPPDLCCCYRPCRHCRARAAACLQRARKVSRGRQVACSIALRAGQVPRPC